MKKSQKVMNHNNIHIPLHIPVFGIMGTF